MRKFKMLWRCNGSGYVHEKIYEAASMRLAGAKCRSEMYERHGREMLAKFSFAGCEEVL